MNKILILGNGWIGNMLKAYYGDRADLFSRRIEFLGIEVKYYDAVINTVAKTNIDWCEANQEEAERINAHEAARVAELCTMYGAKYVFISSACIFESKDLNDVKFEDSEPNPQCFYAKTKVLAEKLIKEIDPDALIFRPRLPLSDVPHSRNTINKILSYPELQDNQESVDVVEDMIPVMADLIDKGETGIFHLANEGTISPAEIGELFKHTFTVVPKVEMDRKMLEQGRAKRVTTYVSSKRIPLLPNIRERIKILAERYNAAK